MMILKIILTAILICICCLNFKSGKPQSVLTTIVFCLLGASIVFTWLYMK